MFEKKVYCISLFIIMFTFFSLGHESVFAAYLRDVPQTLTQPDGTVFHCYATGDEFYNWLHDEDGYTIIKSKQGFYVYAVKQNNQLAPSNEVAGKKYKDKKTKITDLKAKGLKPGINLDPKAIKAIRLDIANKMKVKKPKLRDDATPAISQAPGEGEGAIPSTTILQAPSTGTMNNIVIFIRFADQLEYTDSISTYDGAFNSNAISMKNYFKEASYNNLTISSTFYPAPSGGTVVSYQDSFNRNYYSPYNAETNSSGYQTQDARQAREHQLLKNAVNSVSSQIPAGLDVDGDNDGYVDNVVFIIQGATDGWSSLLWPHRWAMYDDTYAAEINDARVWDYNFQLSGHMAGDPHFGVSVLCHEMFHSLGAPDLYHYSGDGLQPAGQWDIMEWGTSVPQHMTAYMKYQYGGWISSIPAISASGTYNLNPLSTSSTGNCFKIPSPFSSTEYFVVEYRKKNEGVFDQGLPGTGMLVYRINTAVDVEFGNRNGPPDMLYIFRPGGTLSNNGSWNQAHLSLQTGRTQINDITDPFTFLSDGAFGGVFISNISSAGTTISFDLNLPSREISVFDGEIPIVNNTATAVDFGYTPPGTPIVKTITIYNSGSETLTLSSLNCPSGFSLAGTFPASIAPHTGDSFQIRMDADAAGSHSGTVSFNTNDSDENPFSFPVSGIATCVQYVQLDLTTDNWGVETTWELRDSESNVLYSGGPYEDNQSYMRVMALLDGDFEFVIYDAYGDGICCSEGNGSYSLVNITTGEVYVDNGGEFGYGETTPFNILVDKKGDIDENCRVDLQDAILALQLNSGIIPGTSVNTNADVNGNGKIGIEESIYVMEKISGLRE